MAELSSAAFWFERSSAAADGDGAIGATWVVAGTSWVKFETAIPVLNSVPVTELKPKNATNTISNESATFEDFLASNPPSLLFIYNTLGYVPM